MEFRNNQIYDDNGKLIGKGLGEIYEDHIDDKEKSRNKLLGIIFDILDIFIDIIT